MDGISVTGLDKALKVVRQAPAKVDEELKHSMHGALERVLEQARAEAPKKTGHLAASGRIEIEGTTAVIRFGGDAAPYAGARMFARRRGHHPDPFLFRVANRSAPSVLQRIDRDFHQLLERLSRA